MPDWQLAPALSEHTPSMPANQSTEDTTVLHPLYAECAVLTRTVGVVDSFRDSPASRSAQARAQQIQVLAAPARTILGSRGPDGTAPTRVRAKLALTDPDGILTGPSPVLHIFLL